MDVLRTRTLMIGLFLAFAFAVPARGQTSPKAMYTAAMMREKALRTEWQQAGNERMTTAAIKQARAIVAAYEAIVWRYPVSGYTDNALWQAAVLEADLFARAEQEPDRRKAVSLFTFLAREYPSSPFARTAASQGQRLEASDAPAAARGNASASVRSRTDTTKSAAQPPPAATEVPKTRALGSQGQGRSSESSKVEMASPAVSSSAGEADTPGSDVRPPGAVSTIRDIKRTILPEIVRVAIELDREATFREEQVDGPARLLFDFAQTKAGPTIQDANWTFREDVVRKIRVGRHANQTTRVVLDLEGVSHYTVVTLTNPYRVLVDCERVGPQSVRTVPQRTPTMPQKAQSAQDVSPKTQNAQDVPPKAERTDPPKAQSAAKVPTQNTQGGETEDPPSKTQVAQKTTGQKRVTPQPEATAAAEADEPRRAARPDRAETPKAPPTEKPGPPPSVDGNRFSMARQLGLGISRVVIDPGHGGHDPGAESGRLNEAEVVLDIALRLERLLARERGVNAVMTRRSDAFVPLEERTAIANREQADLFLSIHANASRNQKARGIETYYLNFATNPEAEAVAARENAASGQTMNHLPDIIKAIALNNKLDESKDFAALVQQALAGRLRTSNSSLKDLGVKQAPFVVLIGAAMPSVLAEVSFLTNKREGQLLASESYRQRIAEALCDAILRYKRTLKSAQAFSQ